MKNREFTCIKMGLTKYALLLTFLFFVVHCLYAGKEEQLGSCEEYAVVVCEICGDQSDVCIAITKQVKEHLEDVQCKKAVTHLPSMYKNGTDEVRAVLEKAVCKGKVDVNDTSR